MESIVKETSSLGKEETLLSISTLVSVGSRQGRSTKQGQNQDASGSRFPQEKGKGERKVAE